MEDDTGYYVLCNYEPANLDELLAVHIGGIIQTRTQTDVVVYFRKNSRAANSLKIALKESHEYFNPTNPVPDGFVRCINCRMCVNPHDCLSVHDRGIVTFECRSKCIRVNPPFIEVSIRKKPSYIPPSDKMKRINVPREIISGIYFLHEPTGRIFKYRNCRCSCFSKWSILNDSDTEKAFAWIETYGFR